VVPSRASSTAARVREAAIIGFRVLRAIGGAFVAANAAR
jgi:hypothetical protein